MIEISSATNPRFKLLARLLESGRERRKAGLTVLDGVHLVQAYREHVGRPEEVAISRSALQNAEIVHALGADASRALVFTDALFQQLSTVTTPTGILALVRLPAAQTPAADIGACLILEDLQDPGNLGSILRSAAASGTRDVLLTPACAHAWSPRVLRAGMGAHFALRLYEHCDIAAFASRYRGRLLATVRGHATSVFESDLRGDVGLMFGNEGSGLSTRLLELASDRISIPMPGAAESLNVAAAAAVCLFERVRQLGAVSAARD
ncbi:MAG: TrmH family RNA methyltransferase [Rhodospirillaceae bacterium]